MGHNKGEEAVFGDAAKRQEVLFLLCLRLLLAHGKEHAICDETRRGVGQSWGRSAGGAKWAKQEEISRRVVGE
jgi:hypothetical protein